MNSGTRHRLEEPFSQPSECHSFLGSPEIWPGALCAEGVNPELQSSGIWLSPALPAFWGDALDMAGVSLTLLCSFHFV